jgi:Cu/Ag efflux protein CusF
MNTRNTFLFAMLAASAAAQAQMSPDMKMTAPMKASAPAGQAATVMTNAVVQKVDAAKGNVTLKHEDITNVGMPAMTMAFGVADKKMLDNMKAGDKVHFHVEIVNGAPTVTRIEEAH